MPKGDKLNARQQLFCREYLIDLNGTQAAIRAGYSKKTAQSIAAENLSKPIIIEFINQLKSKREVKLEIKSANVLRELDRLGNSDIRLIYDDNGCVLHPTEWPDELAKAIASIEVDEIYEFDNVSKRKELIGYTKKVKLWNKPQALELLGRHKKLFTDKIEIEDKTGIAERLDKKLKK